MKKTEFDYTRGGYGLRYFFNAGTDKKTGITDEEGTIFCNEDTGEVIGEVSGITPDEIIEMTEEDFSDLLYDNYIM